MTRLLAFLGGLMCASANAAAPLLRGAIDGAPSRATAVFFLRTGERLVLSRQDDAAMKPARWFQIAPELRAYNNRPGEHARLAPIRYRRTAANAVPSSRIELSFETPGTRYFCAGAVTPERFTTAEPIQRKYAGRVVQVVVRAGDSYEEFLEELLGTPFVMGPAVVPGGWHQTDQRVGSDCASFATYGRRRMGRPVPYAGPVGIVRFLRPLGSGPLAPPGADGVYRDTRGRRIRVGGDSLRPGDIVHFGAQVAVFHADRGTRGVLDADDLLFQSWRTTPYVTAIRASGFFDHAIRLYRWRDVVRLIPRWKTSPVKRRFSRLASLAC
jgi:hypothetical protein